MLKQPKREWATHEQTALMIYLTWKYKSLYLFILCQTTPSSERILINVTANCQSIFQIQCHSFGAHMKFSNAEVLWSSLNSFFGEINFFNIILTEVIVSVKAFDVLLNGLKPVYIWSASFIGSSTPHWPN